MKQIIVFLLCLFVYSCAQDSGLQLPEQLSAITGRSVQLGDAIKDIRKHRKQLVKNEELSEYTSSVYYEKITDNPDFTGISYRFSWGKLSAVTLSRDVDNQDISLDTSVINIIRILQQNYGRNYTVYQRNHGIMKIPAVCWTIPDKGYVTIYYVPYKLFKQYSSKYKSTPNEMIVKFSTTKNKWLEPTQVYTRSNLGLDTL